MKVPSSKFQAPELIEAVRRLLQSADSVWYDQNEGHDWRLAVDAARALLATARFSPEQAADQEKMVVLGFEFGERVRMRELQCAGRVVQVRMTGEGTQYLVVYWWCGEQKEAWCVAGDLERGEQD